MAAERNNKRRLRKYDTCHRYFDSEAPRVKDVLKKKVENLSCLSYARRLKGTRQAKHAQ